MRPDRSPASGKSPDERLTGLEVLSLALWSVVSFYVAAWVIAERLFLVSVYGWARVRGEHLAILHMPKHSPWPVSNGDQIDPSRTGLHTALTVLLWFGFTIAFHLFQRVLWHHRALRSAARPVA